MEIWVKKQKIIEDGEGIAVLYNICDMDEDFFYLWFKVNGIGHWAVALLDYYEEEYEDFYEDYSEEEEFQPYTVSWGYVPIDVKYAHFVNVFPNRAKDNYYLYPYLIRQALPYEKPNGWIEEHKIYTSHITMAVYKEIGEFQKVVLRRSYADIIRTGASNYEYIIDDKWMVTVYSNESECYPYHNYKISDYNEYILTRKNRKRRAKRLSEKLKIPFEVANLTVNIKKDEDAELALRKLQEVKRKASEKIIRGCGGTMDTKLDALSEVLGNYLYDLCPEEALLDTLVKYLIK